MRTTTLTYQIVKAITPILQRYLEENDQAKTKPEYKTTTLATKHQENVTKNALNDDLIEMILQKIESQNRLDSQLMRDIINLKRQNTRMKQTVIAKTLNTSQPTVSNYLTTFRKYYKDSQKFVQTKLEVA